MMRLSGVLYLDDVEIRGEDIEAGAVALMKTLRPHWQADHIKVTVRTIILLLSYLLLSIFYKVK